MSLENIKVFYEKGTNKINETIDKVFKLSGEKTGFQKFKASLISIFLGLLIAGIFIMATGNNFLDTYWLMIKGSFHQGNWKVLMVVMGAFVLFGLSVAFSFRTGLFNIGGSGQMFLGGGIAIYVMLKLHSLSSGTIFLAFLIAILVGFIWAGLAGFLKAYFNVHEVVSTILLNWIAFYIIQQIFSVGSEFYSGIGGPSSVGLISTIGSFPSFVIQYAWLISLITIALVIFIIWFVLSKTVFGYNLKVVGESVDVAKYAGINTKLKVIISLGVSGAIAGLGGAILYILKFKQVSSMETLPTYGFDGIVIALLAFNSPIGILASGIFYGVLNQGQQIIQFEQQLGNETYQIIIGIIIYFAAISTIFFRVNPMQYVKKYIALSKMTLYKESRENRKRLLDIQRAAYKDSLSEYKELVSENKDELKRLKLKYKGDKKKLNMKFRSGGKMTTESILELELELKTIKIYYNESIASLGYYIKTDAKSLKKSEFKEIKAIFKTEVDSKYEELLSLKDSIINNSALIRKRELQLNVLELTNNKIKDVENKFMSKQKSIIDSSKGDKEAIKSSKNKLSVKKDKKINELKAKAAMIKNNLIKKTSILDNEALKMNVETKISKISFSAYMKGNE